jgi:ribosomal protein S18 acetylase RimI-like enzyme
MNGVIIRRATTADAAAYGALRTVLDQEGPYVMLAPEERDWTLAAWEQELTDLAPRGIMFTAVDGADVVGFVRAQGQLYNPFYEVTVAIGVGKAYQRQGLGARLMQTLEDWARAAGVHRFRLNVAVDNEPALALYNKFGFEVDGYIEGAPRLGKAPQDLFVMIKWLVDEDAFMQSLMKKARD